MTVGAQLRTRDGRVIGNAVLLTIEYNYMLKTAVAAIRTDVGSIVKMTLSELKNRFYPPIYKMKL